MAKTRRTSAVETLTENVEFDVDVEFDYLAVRAYDQDPERAAAMANFMVGRLNEENAQLSSQSARESRVFIERRLRRAESDLDSVRSEMQSFQEVNGVVELESQAQAFMSSMAELRGQVAQAEVRYQTLAQQYGPDNAQVQAARAAMQAARRQISGALGGQDAMLPVSYAAPPGHDAALRGVAPGSTHPAADPGNRLSDLRRGALPRAGRVRGRSGDRCSRCPDPCGTTVASCYRYRLDAYSVVTVLSLRARSSMATPPRGPALRTAARSCSAELIGAPLDPRASRTLWIRR